MGIREAFPWVLLANEQGWAGLPDNIREGLGRAAERLQAIAFEAASAEELSDLARLREVGLNVTGLPVVEAKQLASGDAFENAWQAWSAAVDRAGGGPGEAQKLLPKLRQLAAMTGTGGGGCPDDQQICDDGTCLRVCE